MGRQGSQAHLGLMACLQLGKWAGGRHSRVEGLGQRLHGDGCSQGSAGGAAATGTPWVTHMRGEAGQSPGPLSACRPPEGRGLCECTTLDPQHQQVFEEFSGPSGLPTSSSSSANGSSLLARVRRPSSSFLWACSTSSVRRVKDWETKAHALVCCPLPSQSCNCPRGQAPLCPPLLTSPLCWTGIQSSHLFNVEVGAGTCFIEVHAIFLSQLQKTNIPERESVTEGRCPQSLAHTSSTALTAYAVL